MALTRAARCNRRGSIGRTLAGSLQDRGREQNAVRKSPVQRLARVLPSRKILDRHRKRTKSRRRPARVSRKPERALPPRSSPGKHCVGLAGPANAWDNTNCPRFRTQCHMTPATTSSVLARKCRLLLLRPHAHPRCRGGDQSRSSSLIDVFDRVFSSTLFTITAQ